MKDEGLPMSDHLWLDKPHRRVRVGEDGRLHRVEVQGKNVGINFYDKSRPFIKK